MTVHIGVDTGGTFSDFIRIDDGAPVIHKVLSTPENPARAVLRGLAHLCPDLEGVELVHGSTVATNALLERKGARTALVSTRGFEDVLEIGRQTRPHLYDPFVEKLPPLWCRGACGSASPNGWPTTARCWSPWRRRKSTGWSSRCGAPARSPWPSACCTPTPTRRTRRPSPRRRGASTFRCRRRTASCRSFASTSAAAPPW